MEYFFNFDKLAYLKGRRPEGCILCLVAAGSDEVERLVVAETGRMMAVLNLYPYNPGHLLLFPKAHVTDLRELDEASSLEMDRLVKKSLDRLDRCFSPSGYNIGYNMGLDAGGSIEHLHIHIIPRYPHEIGIAELLAGKRVLVQDPRASLELLRASFSEAYSGSRNEPYTT